MSAATKMVTEREAVEREREAFRRGAIWHHGAPWLGTSTLQMACDEAARLYPIPKVTRPRVVQDARNGMRYRVNDGRVEWASAEREDWEPCAITLGTADVGEIRLFADLLGNPTEEVEA